MLRKFAFGVASLGMIGSAILAPVKASPPSQDTTYPVITSENVANLNEVDSFGEGIYLSVAWGPDDSSLYIGNAIGVYQLPAADLDAVPELVIAEDLAKWNFDYYDGEIVLSQNSENYVVWSIADGTVLFEFDAHRAYLNPYRPQVASKDTSSIVKIWDGLTGEITSEFSLPEDITWVNTEIVFSHNPERLYLSEKNILHVVDIATGEIQMTYELPNSAMTFGENADGSLLALSGGRGDDVNVYLLDAETLEQVSVWETGLDRVPNSNSISFSPDSKYLVASAGIWDIENETEIFAARPVFGRTWFSQDGTVLFTSGEAYKVADFMDVSAEEKPERLIDYDGIMQSYSFNGDGTQLAAVISQGSYRIVVFDTATGEIVNERSILSADYDAVAFTPDNTQMVTLSQSLQTVRVVDIATHDVIHEITGMRFGQMASLENGQFAISARKDIHILDAATGELSLFTTIENTPNLLRLSVGGTLLAMGDSSGNILVWDLASGDLQYEFKIEKGIWSMALSEEIGQLAVQGVGADPMLFDLESGETLLAGDLGAGNGRFGYTFNAAGNQMVIAGDEIILFDTTTLEGTPQDYKSDQYIDVIYNQDETLLFGYNSFGFGYFDLATHEAMFKNMAMSSITLSPDGTMLAIASRNGSVRLYAVTE